MMNRSGRGESIFNREPGYPPFLRMLEAASKKGLWRVQPYCSELQLFPYSDGDPQPALVMGSDVVAASATHTNLKYDNTMN
jgi:hypothetical protein